MIFCTNAKCINWDSDKNGGHCMLVQDEDLICLMKKERDKELEMMLKETANKKVMEEGHE